MTRSIRPNARRSPQTEPESAGVAPSFAGRMALRIDDVAAALGVSRSTIERERRAKRFPEPDRVVGTMPLWRPETIHAWLEGGGA